MQRLTVDSSLEEIIVSEKSKYFCTEKGILYNKEKTRLLRVPGGTKLMTVTVPETVEVIDAYSFQKCKNLEEVILPKSVKEISCMVFMDCPKLKRVVIPDGNMEYMDSSSFGTYFQGEVPLSVIETPKGSFADRWIKYIKGDSPML